MLLKMKHCTLLLLIVHFSISCSIQGLRANNNTSLKDSLVYSVSNIIAGETYRADYRSNSMLYIIRSENDTVVTRKEEGISPVPLVFEDYNNDGYPDVRYGYNSNYYYETILLFIPDTKEFRPIEGIDDCDYAYSKNIKGTGFYYSYSPNGCGKNNWISKLFVIKDYRIRDLGLIKYKQCEDEDKGMYVYRLTNDTEILIEKFPINESVSCENYWIKNLKNFE